MKHIATISQKSMPARQGTFLGCSSNSKNPLLLILIENWLGCLEASVAKS